MLTPISLFRNIRPRRHTAALLCAVLAGLGLSGPLSAQSPVPDPNPSPAVPTPYSSPVFHAGGALTPPSFATPLPVPFPDPLYSQLQGTPTGLVPGTGVNAGSTVATEIPSFLLGNYLPTAPPTTPGTYFPNHFRDGTAFSWSAPLTFLTPNAVAPTPSLTGAAPVPNVESTPTAVNIAEYPFIANVQYVGTLAGTTSTPDPLPRYGRLPVPVIGTNPALPGAADPAHLIRQLVYFGRVENLTTTTGATTTNTPVGAIYCVDGFTGEVVWRFQTSQVSDGTVFSTPAVAYINVLTNAGAAVPIYANKAVVVAGDNNGFVYCLDATGNGDGTSNSDATVATTGIPGTNGLPIYGAQPTYGTTVSTTVGPHVGTTSVYWIYRPDPSQPHTAAGAATGYDVNSNLPVPGPFGIASPNIYVERSISTTPDVVTGRLQSNAVIYIGNTRDCVYALDGLGVANSRTGTALPAFNASLAPAVTGISDLVPTCNPRWWFTPDGGSNLGVSFESTPAISPPAAPFPTYTVITSSANPAQPGTAVTFTATVTDATGNVGLPTGTVTFTIAGAAQTVTLVAGVATSAPVTLTTAGANTVTAVYSGDGNFSASTSAFTETVDSGTGTSAVVVTSSVNPSTLGQAVTFTATVSDGGPTAGPVPPTGTVTLTVAGTTQTLPVIAGAVTFLPVTLTTTGPNAVTATYSGDANFSTSTTAFTQYVFGEAAPTVYIGSSQELGPTSNAGRLYAIDGFSGPSYAVNTTTGAGRNINQRAKWAFPNLYTSGSSGNVGGLPVRPALGNITGSPVVFTNTDDVVPAAGAVPAHPRTRIYFAANSGLEVPAGGTTPNPRPASDATGRVWAVNLDGTTATSATATTPTVWSFPQANDPNNSLLDNTPEPTVPMGAFLNSTPAMGFVQFPLVIQYGTGPTDYTHTDAVNTDIKGKSVPMLYVGTNGTADLGFYALDVNGRSDAERGVYRLESPTGAPFQSSPVLVVNSSTATAPGNGGAVYATTGNQVLQITATPISNINTQLTSAFVGVDATFSGGGPISGPAVAAADTSDLATNVAGFSTLYGGKNATDFVYFGDGTLGFCRGITVIDANYGGAVPPTNFGGVTDTNPVTEYSNKFFLQTYLFDGMSAHPANSTNMSQAIPLNGLITGFEWGGFVYIRIGNVVPPGFDPNSPNTSLLVADPTDPTLFYGDGQAVTFNVGSASRTIPATVLTALTGVYPETGFIKRSDTLTAAQALSQLQLVTPPNPPDASGWIAAASYPIGSDQTRIGDTPGAYRRLSGASQTAIRYTLNADGSYTAAGTLGLTIQTSVGSQYSTPGTPPTLSQTLPQEQPTFGILNPLAVEGYGVPLPVSTGSTTSPVPVADPNGAGPFGTISSPTAPTQQDLAAFTNGSNYLASLPKSGYNSATEDPTNATQVITEQIASIAIPIVVATSVGSITDGTTGSNTSDNNATPAGYGLDVENRSLVGTGDRTLFSKIPVAMQSANAHWNDNTTVGGVTQNGPGATVNPLPWEDFPSSIVANTSRDYPDIPASAIAHTLYSGAPTVQSSDLNAGAGNALLDFTTGTASAPSRVLDYVKVAVSVPLHQSANLQVWDGTTKSPTTPDTMTTSDNIFPHGYIEGTGSGVGINTGVGSPQRVFVDLSGRGRFATTYPYRDVQSFVGVPVNMKTSIQDGTIGLGKAPSSLGIQTEQNTVIGLFDPYNPYYQPFFRPVTVLNEGNTNLLNVQFNQQLVNSTGQSQTLLASSDGNDPLSTIGGFDYLGTSGPIASNQRTTYTAGTPFAIPGTTVDEEPFVFRTSLDTDLMQAYGRNSHVLADTNPLYPGAGGAVNSLYPGATFHKPRAGGSQPTTLTVPDVPDAGDDPSFSLPVAAAPVAGSTALPYVGISVPFGTPVGTYATADTQPLRVFEGRDSLPSTATANDIDAAKFQPPKYGGAIGGHGSPTQAPVTQLPLDANFQPTLPVSNPGVKLQINVLEDRMTDGYTFGSLPMIDVGQAAGTVAAPISTPDFAPAAFRDPTSGNLSVYWTSGRSGTSYGIYGANVPFNLNSAAHAGNYFYPSSPTTNWWSLFTPTLATGTSSGLSIAQDVNPANTTNISAFAVTVNTTAPYTNTLNNYPVTPGTGVLGVATAITPPSDASQVKYGVKGVYTNFTTGPNLWAFWTGVTRGRTAIYYNSQAQQWGTSVALLPVPAGLTSVADASPILMTAPINGTLGSTIDVTYSGTGPDGNIDLYVSRYQPGTTTATASQLNLVPFPAVTENLRPVGGWYQSRDAAWSRAGALNLSVNVGGTLTSLLYNGTTPLFTKAIYDKASGLLVLTGVKVPIITPLASPPLTTTNTVYVDAATGRLRFSPVLLPTQNFAQIRATFSPTARRLTIDSRADTAPVTFMDTKLKTNDGPGLSNVEADRRWTIWRKSGVAGTPATLYYKTQRLTAYLPYAIGLTTHPATGTTPVTYTTNLTSVIVNGTDITGQVDVDYARQRLYFPISYPLVPPTAATEGQTAIVSYTDAGGTTRQITTDTIQWQDEPLANNNDVPPADSAAGLDTVLDNGVLIDNAANENNVAAFLDPFASVTSSHKVWLFWNSTRNGTADIYSETIDPRFAPGP